MSRFSQLTALASTAAAAIIALSAPAQADTLVVGPLAFDINPSAAFDQNDIVLAERMALSFDQFDPSLGTLSSVRVAIDSSWRFAFNGSVMGPDLNGGQGGPRLSREGLFSIFLDNGGSDELLDSRTGTSGNQCQMFDRFVPCSSGTSSTLDVTATVPSSLYSVVQGLGTFDIIADLSASQLIDAVFNDVTFMSSTFSARFNGDVTVTYTYEPATHGGGSSGGTPVSEPASLALLGLGLMGLAGARRRRA